MYDTMRNATFTIEDGRTVETHPVLNRLGNSWELFDQHADCPVGAIEVTRTQFVMYCQDHKVKHLITELV